MIWLLLSHKAAGSPWQELLQIAVGPKSLTDLPEQMAMSYVKRLKVLTLRTSK